jgi:hypothetical protein
MENWIWTEGNKDNNGFFDIAFTPYFNSQKTINYIHNGKDKIEFDIKNP